MAEPTQPSSPPPGVGKLARLHMTSRSLGVLALAIVVLALIALRGEARVAAFWIFAVLGVVLFAGKLAEVIAGSDVLIRSAAHESGRVPELSSTLSAPEMAALVDGQRIGDARALTLAMQELVIRGALDFIMVREPRRHWLFGTVGEYALVPGKAYDIDLRRPLHAVLQVYQQLHSKRYIDGRTGVHVRTLATAMFERYHKRIFFSPPTHVYVQAEVLPSLEANGLYSSGWHSWALTDRGRVARADLKARLRYDRILSRADLKARLRYYRILKGASFRVEDVLRAHARSHGTFDTTNAVDIAFRVIRDEVGGVFDPPD